LCEEPNIVNVSECVEMTSSDHPCAYKSCFYFEDGYLLLFSTVWKC